MVWIQESEVHEISRRSKPEEVAGIVQFDWSMLLTTEWSGVSISEIADDLGFLRTIGQNGVGKKEVLQENGWFELEFK